MATTYTKHVLSASSNGRPIAITITNATGELLHTAPTGTTGVDEVYAWATNLSTATTDAHLTVEFGGTSGSDQMKFTIPSRDTIMVIPGLSINNGLEIRAFATASTIFNVAGYVNRVTPT